MRRFMALMCVPAIIVLLVACGSSSSNKSAKTSSTTPKTTSTTATPATGATTVAVKTATSATLGKIVVTNAGKTVYTLTNNGEPVACPSSNGCSGFWPAVLLPAGQTKATGGEGVTGLGESAAGGGQQVTQDGKPLYRFSGDTNAGDAKGENLHSFGGDVARRESRRFEQRDHDGHDDGERQRILRLRRRHDAHELARRADALVSRATMWRSREN